MVTIAQALDIAVRHHQAGNLPQAEQIYRQILEVDPVHAEALHLLGLLAHQTGRSDLATRSIGDALRLKPGYAEAHGNLGTVFRDLGRLAEAVAEFEQALRLRPAFAEVHNNLGNTLLELARPAEALAHLEQASQLRPQSAEICNNLGNALRELGRLALALEQFDRAVLLRPGYVEAHNNRGNTFRELGRPNEALACYDEALRLRPGFAEVHNNRGNAYREMERLAEAAECYQEAVRLRPDDSDARNNLGVIYREEGRLAEALEQFSRAVAAEPDNVVPHWNRALLWLLMGNLAQGWPEYEWRWRSRITWKMTTFADRGFAQPRWDGGPLQGRTILVTAEQGLGDTLQFLRYLPRVKEQGGTVVFECQAPLVPFVSASDPAGIDQLVAEKSPLPPFDVHVPLLSLPLLLGNTLETIPAAVPYLRAEERRVEHWRRELAKFPGLKVGIGWQGNPMTEGDRRRSVPLKYFEPLARIPGVHLISLQRGPGCEQVAGLEGRFEVTVLSDRFDQAGAFVDRAAVLENLDLFVTSDSAIAHLAGALGVRAWVALSLVPDWRWLLEREDCPWYPSMRLFRQTEMGDWQGVFERIARALRAWLATSHDSSSRHSP